MIQRGNAQSLFLFFRELLSMKKVILILLLLTVVFSAGCIQYGPYPDYESYEKSHPPSAQGQYFSAIALVTQYGDYLTSDENLCIQKLRILSTNGQMKQKQQFVNQKYVTTILRLVSLENSLMETTQQFKHAADMKQLMKK